MYSKAAAVGDVPGDRLVLLVVRDPLADREAADGPLA